MQSWTVENWLTLIGALTAAFVSIWNAVHGNQIAAKLEEHEARAQTRHENMVCALTEPEEPKGVGA